MHIEELAMNIQPLSKAVVEEAQQRFDNLIKPVGSLAQLEEMTSRYAGIIGSADKKMVTVPRVRLLLLWGETGQSGEIKAVMEGKKALTKLAKNVRAIVIPQFITGTTAGELLEEGAMLTGEYIGEEKANLICLGSLSPLPAVKWDSFIEEEDSLLFLEKLDSPSVAAMTGAILQAAGMRVPILLDGVSSCLAALAAAKFNRAVLQYCFAGQESLEPDAGFLLQKLGLKAPLKMNLPNGEGVGALTCLQLFDAGIKAYTEMETFAEAGVHVEEETYSLKVQEERKVK